jgi:hypothetical protein
LILLVSDNQDVSTNEVVGWLRKFQVDFVRLGSQSIWSKPMSIASGAVASDAAASVSAVWFRRSLWQTPNGLPNSDALSAFASEEYTAALKIYYKQVLSSARALGSPFLSRVDKFEMLNLAAKLGLSTPKTLISNDKTVLSAFIKEQQKVITKPLTDAPILTAASGTPKTFYTNSLTVKDLEAIPDLLFPSMVQQAIEKAYDLRVFYLLGQCYAVATMPTDRIDSRIRHNGRLPIMQPYTLPPDLAHKIQAFMQTLGLNTGSLDFVVDKSESTAYFLEINPIGQFGAVSRAGNYNLEEKIAQYLAYGT